MKVGVVDIGTNSMRLLIADEAGEILRSTEVTGLGRGVDRSGALSEPEIESTLAALRRFGDEMTTHAVEHRVAMATSASRDAVNREMFFDRAEDALGVRPSLLGGDEEARLSYSGATLGLEADPPVVVSDIGGGSTEFVTATVAVSIDIGSVRLTERAIPSRPPSQAELAAARSSVAALFAGIHLDTGTLVGVAGTWTSLAAITRSPPVYTAQEVPGQRMKRSELADVVGLLAGMTLEETKAISALDPKRAPVILAGALVAEGVMETLEADEVLISVRDSLDGMAMRLLAYPEGHPGPGGGMQTRGA